MFFVPVTVQVTVPQLQATQQSWSSPTSQFWDVTVFHVTGAEPSHSSSSYHLPEAPRLFFAAQSCLRICAETDLAELKLPAKNVNLLKSSLRMHAGHTIR